MASRLTGPMRVERGPLAGDFGLERGPVGSRLRLRPAPAIPRVPSGNRDGTARANCRGKAFARPASPRFRSGPTGFRRARGAGRAARFPARRFVPAARRACQRLVEFAGDARPAPRSSRPVRASAAAISSAAWTTRCSCSSDSRVRNSTSSRNSCSRLATGSRCCCHASHCCVWVASSIRDSVSACVLRLFLVGQFVQLRLQFAPCASSASLPRGLGRGHRLAQRVRGARDRPVPGR